MKLKMNKVRGSFLGLFTAEAFKPGDDPKFKATFLVPADSPQHKVVEDAILAAVTAKWGAKDAAKIIASIRNNPNKFCYQDGNTKSYDGYEGMFALSAKNSVRPLVLDMDKSPLVEEDGKIYSGCYLNASLEIFCYENSGKGVSCSLGGVQYAGKGDAFGGGSSASKDDFDELADGADAEDLV